MYSYENIVCLMFDVVYQVQLYLVGVLDWVGMDGIEVFVYFDVGDGDVQCVSVQVGVFVNFIWLDKCGIYMLWLYLLVDEYLSKCMFDVVMFEGLLKVFLELYKDLVDCVCISICFDQLVCCVVLCSVNSGWCVYLVLIEVSLGVDGFCMELGIEVVYLFICLVFVVFLCQLIQEQFVRDFVEGVVLDCIVVLVWFGSEQGIVVMLYVQCSVVCLLVCFDSQVLLNLIGLLDCVEQVLGILVQIVVKCEDEQVFVFVNGGNLMFCEDVV